jgi:hypothetical protein
LRELKLRNLTVALEVKIARAWHNKSRPMKLFKTELEESLRFTNSYNRLPTLLDAYKRGWGRRHPDTWFAVLSECWSSCDNISRFQRELETIFRRHRGLWVEMTPSNERQSLDALPQVVTVFRGCGTENKLGLSWSLSREIAAGFPFLHRYKTPNPLLITARIKRANIVGLMFEDRGEDEVIALVSPANVVSEEALICRP